MIVEADALAISAELFEFLLEGCAVEGEHGAVGGAMEALEPVAGETRRDGKQAVIGVAGQQGGLHDDGLQRHATEFFGDDRASLGEIAKGARDAVEVLLFGSFVGELEIAEFAGGGFAGLAIFIRAIDLGGHAFAAVGEVNDDIVNVVVALGGVAHYADIA